MNNALILTFSFPFVDSSLLKPGPQVDRDTGIYLILDYVGSCQSHYRWASAGPGLFLSHRRRLFTNQGLVRHNS